jgi:hypothetical protein
MLFICMVEVVVLHDVLKFLILILCIRNLAVLLSFAFGMLSKMLSLACWKIAEIYIVVSHIDLRLNTSMFYYSVLPIYWAWSTF